MTGRAVDAKAEANVTANGWHPRARRVDSPNHDTRSPQAQIELIVIHHISLPAGQFGSDDIEMLFTNRLDPARHADFQGLAGLRVSAHFLIRRDGELVQFVDCFKRAWHAGASNWRGRERCNDFSVGIELEGTGSHAFTAKQYQRLVSLTQWLLARFPVSGIAGHSEIAPGRKTDPGPLFDWAHYLSSAHLPSSLRANRAPDQPLQAAPLKKQ